ncbi:MAG: lamin tail domain-containing protein, partial [Chloroflexota bacterium]|nr:lamin tail domain-containing protein [Chloroflexota bacterium]
MSVVPRFRWLVPVLAAVAVTAAAGWPVAAYLDPGPPAPAVRPDHLVISELLTGAASASDEFVEIFNPTARDLALDGLELVYATASGSSLTRKVGWPTSGAAVVPPGRHLLVANQAGSFASIADQLYAGGLAATGGSIALRVAGASSAVDAVGWGNAAVAWREGSAAVAPPPGASLERLPGGAAGSWQDTDDNLADFRILENPAPENGAAAAVPPQTPGASPSATTGAATAAPSAPVPSSPSPSVPGDTGPPRPTPSWSPAPTSDPSSADGSTPPTTASVAPSLPITPSPVPSDEAIPSPPATPELVTGIADARALSDGSQVTVIGVSLTDSSFSDGGGYLADPTGGIAVIGGSPFSRG